MGNLDHLIPTCVKNSLSSRFRNFKTNQKQFTLRNHLTLLSTTMNGNLVLYKMLQAYSIFDMKVTGFVLLAVSIT